MEMQFSRLLPHLLILKVKPISHIMRKEIIKLSWKIMLLCLSYESDNMYYRTRIVNDAFAHIDKCFSDLHAYTQRKVAIISNYI